MDDVFHLLQNSRRREVLRYLEGVEDWVELSDVAEQVAAWEHDTTVEALSSKERKRVYVALYQSHLPKLDEVDVIEYDQHRGTLRPTRRIELLSPYLKPPRRERDGRSEGDADVAAPGDADRDTEGTGEAGAEERADVEAEERADVEDSETKTGAGDDAASNSGSDSGRPYYLGGSVVGGTLVSLVGSDVSVFASLSGLDAAVAVWALFTAITLGLPYLSR
jgi:hypothetical protein